MSTNQESSGELTEAEMGLIAWLGFAAGCIAGTVFDSWHRRVAGGLAAWFLATFTAGAVVNAVEADRDE